MAEKSQNADSGKEIKETKKTRKKRQHNNRKFRLCWQTLTNRPRTVSRFTQFVCSCSESFPMNPEKRHSFLNVLHDYFQPFSPGPLWSITIHVRNGGIRRAYLHDTSNQGHLSYSVGMFCTTFHT